MIIKLYALTFILIKDNEQFTNRHIDNCRENYYWILIRPANYFSGTFVGNIDFNRRLRDLFQSTSIWNCR